MVGDKVNIVLEHDSEIWEKLFDISQSILLNWRLCYKGILQEICKWYTKN